LRISDVSVIVPNTTPYTLLPESTHRLVRTEQRLTMQDVSPVCKNFTVHPSMLPFGLLQGITVSTPARSGALPSVMYCILLSKDTGQRQSEWVPLGSKISMTHQILACDDDARHPDVGKVAQLTKHDMRFRMMSAAAVANVNVLLKGDVPSTLFVTFHGANVVGPDVSLLDLENASRDKTPIAFLLPPITPKTRLAGAVQKMKDAQKDTEHSQTRHQAADDPPSDNKYEQE